MFHRFRAGLNRIFIPIICSFVKGHITIINMKQTSIEKRKVHNKNHSITK